MATYSFKDLDTLHARSFGTDINNGGTVVGELLGSGAERSGFQITRDGLALIDVAGSNNSAIFGINDFGTVTGITSTNAGTDSIIIDRSGAITAFQVPGSKIG